MFMIWLGSEITPTKVHVERTMSFAEKLTDVQRQGGIEVSNIPIPENTDPSKTYNMYYDPTTNTVFYEYIDRPLTTEEQLAQLQEAQKTPDDKYKELDLTTTALADVKQAKLDQLDYLCSQDITAGFDYTLNGVSYHFSCSVEAQSNFIGTDALFKDGLVTSASWTVINNTSGAVERITLDQATFNSIKLLVFQHINTNVSKFRDTLQPQVDMIVLADYSTEADANKAVDAIVW